MKTRNMAAPNGAYPQELTRYLLEQLQKVDPQFEEEAMGCQAALSGLQGEEQIIGQCVSAREEILEAGMVCMVWKGFALNVELFCDPAKAPCLQGDLELLYREETLAAIPAIRQAQKRLYSAWSAFLNPSECAQQASGFFEYYAYLETVGYKVAHYLGFRAAEHLLGRWMPEYPRYHAYGEQYRQILEAYLQIDLGSLEALPLAQALGKADQRL